MNEQRPSNEQACAVPLIEQLRSVPLNAHHFVELPNNAGYRNIPFGPWCHAAADDIDRLRMAERLNVETVARLQQERDALQIALQKIVKHRLRGQKTQGALIAEAALESLRLRQPPDDDPFQDRVAKWMGATFDAETVTNKVERNHRFLEESLELVQSLGCTQTEAHVLVEYVFGRPVGECEQETGGVMVTLAALANTSNIRVNRAAETELARCWTKIEQIRAKQAGKPRHSLLPGPSLTKPARTLSPEEESERDWQHAQDVFGPSATKEGSTS